MTAVAGNLKPQPLTIGPFLTPHSTVISHINAHSNLEASSWENGPFEFVVVNGS